MKEQLITFETAKLAKEEGFEILTITYALEHLGRIKLPTQSLLQKWLRKKHNIIVLSEPILGFSHIEFAMHIYIKNNIFMLKRFHVSSNKSYEDALEVGLQEALKLIKTI